MLLGQNAVQSVTHGQNAETSKSIEDLARAIEANSDKGDEALIATALLVRELKYRIEAGEAGPQVKWLVWAKARFNRRKTQLYKLTTIANAADPHRALREFRLRESNRQKTSRQRRENGDDERSALIRRLRQCDRATLGKMSKVLASLGY